MANICDNIKDKKQRKECDVCRKKFSGKKLRGVL